MLIASVITKNGMGGGDIKLLSAVALWVGLTNSIIVLISSCLLFFIYSLFIKNKEDKTVAYIPFIFVGIIIVLIKEIIILIF